MTTSTPRASSQRASATVVADDMCIDEFNGDNFDHGPHGFVGGGYMGQVQTNGRPIQTTPVPPGTPKWGATWKTAVRDNYLSTVKPGTGVHGSFYSYRDVYLDLDPTYRDRFGRPLMRMTIDFHDNEIKQNAFLTDRFAEIIKAMGAREVSKEYRKAPYDITDYQTTHVWHDTDRATERGHNARAGAPREAGRQCVENAGTGRHDDDQRGDQKFNAHRHAPIGLDQFARREMCPVAVSRKSLAASC